MPGGRGFGGWLPGSRRRQAEEREERIAANRLRVVRWAEVMEQVLPGFGMFRIQEPRPSTVAALAGIPGTAGNGSYRDTPYYFWEIAEASQFTQPPVPPISQLGAWWVFARNDTFAQLRVMVASHELSPQVADALTKAADAARSTGWTEEDSGNLRAWLLKELAAHPNVEVTSGQGRYAFTRFSFERQIRGESIYTHLEVAPTDRSLRGLPLDAHGKEVTQPDLHRG